MEFVIHKIDEFGDIPWDTLDPERCTFDWSYGMGGHGFDDDVASLNTYTNEEQTKVDQFGKVYVRVITICHVWELPKPIAAMLKMSKKIGRNEQLRDIHYALGIRTNI